MNFRKYGEALENFVVECMNEKKFTRSALFMRGLFDVN